MACLFRRTIAAKLSRTLQQPEELLLPALSAVPVFKKQQTPDFKLSVSVLRLNGILPLTEDIQLQTEDLSRQLKPDNVVEHICAGSGAVNFTINRKHLVQKVLEPFESDTDTAFGLNSELLNRLNRGTTLVEYSSPNIAKKFHAGHLRSTIIGNFIANLKQALGNEVIRMNYLGDWGMQFGAICNFLVKRLPPAGLHRDDALPGMFYRMALNPPRRPAQTGQVTGQFCGEMIPTEDQNPVHSLLGAGFTQFGSYSKLRDNPLQHLFEVYVQVNREAEHNDDLRHKARDFFRKLEEGDTEAMSLWQCFRDITVEEYQHVYKRLGVHFDVYSGESLHQKQAQEVIEKLQSRGLLKTTEKGTGVVDLSISGDMSNVCTVLRSDGTTLYITRDIAAAIDRKDRYKFTEMIYVTDKSQANHFQQLFQILSALGHPWAESCRHVPFGLVKGMKTRTGEVVFLEDVLDEARTRMLHNMNQSKTTKELEDPEDTAEKVGLSALIVQDFKGPLQSDYSFDWDRILQAQGDTGVFLQYTHARLCSLLQKNNELEAAHFYPSLLDEPSAISVVQHLLRYDEVLCQSSQDLQPKHLVNFLLKLCHLTASAHRELPVKGSPVEVAQARRLLFKGSCSVLANGMKLLGITPVQKM